jgi:hypothetical protein
MFDVLDLPSNYGLLFKIMLDIMSLIWHVICSLLKYGITWFKEYAWVVECVCTEVYDIVFKCTYSKLYILVLLLF